ncbi:MFS transporter [Acuticoccus mangrovi]|uniref:MFS transporter n=1 Tax=Acuticoccus mangrovi TaxID=2796142 RepID=A0A934ILB0_9HYPH|nr:MFS transporter [Acuticoccus mangrovi]MBJ3774725.1 MFS transporter [Acuticoccus mangrovi]
MALALRVFLPFALAFNLSFLLRTINAVAGEPIRVELSLSAGDMGLLTGIYFAGYAVCQIPFGILMDRYGPRRVQALVFAVAALGCLVFTVAESFETLVFGRFFIGVGASMALMAPFTAYRQWFTAERVPLVVAAHMTFGAAGSALSGIPTAALIDVVGWRGLFLVVAVLVAIVAAMTFFVVPRRHEPSTSVPVHQLTRELGAVLRSRALWRLAPLATTTQAGMLGILSLWMGPWLREAADLSSGVAAQWVSIAAGGLVVGFWGFGILSSWAARVGRTMQVFIGGATLYALMILLLIVLPPTTAAPLWIGFAAVGTVGVITYNLIAREFVPEMAGRVNTLLNFSVFTLAFIFQWGFGLVLELFPDPTGGATPEGYSFALSLVLGLHLLAFLPFIFVRLKPRESGGTMGEAVG